MAYSKLDDHLEVVVKLVVLGQSSVGQRRSHFITVCLFLLPAYKQSLEERQQTLDHNSTDLIACKRVKHIICRWQLVLPGQTIALLHNISGSEFK